MKNKTLQSIILIIILFLLPLILNSTDPNYHKSKIKRNIKIKLKNQKFNLFSTINFPNQNTLQLNVNKTSKQVSLLSIYTTPLKDDNPQRTNNIRIALQKLNNRIIQPQEEFSFNQQIGNLTPENGYQPAPAIINNRLQPAYGGGVCQASSTLYNTLLQAELKITERHPHSSPVDYVPQDRDATIVPNVKDLKFKNNKESPILIRSEILENKVVIFLFKIHNSEYSLNRLNKSYSF
ncbi:VanW family protein [Acetohalobium arabaticum]|uniref:VanW family protein n=1 Tax=Acetohalobium arabaticum (strain ATCC 49924 / DSM 5501 / Z-7288) TaxID=574087 RepID=D9QQL8_ACEAZ|nr:VanW family protein [Acetohalobium arabaticum]ADL12809.1 VanW family protein [Acetohalobium arabaticum DSM 5501]